MWLVLPTSPSSRVLPDSILDSTSQCRRLAALAMWRSKYRLPLFWRRACATKSWMRLLSGRMFTPSTADAIVDEWMESLPDFRARPHQSRAAEKAQKTIDGSGQKSSESFATLSHDGRFLKTYEDFSLFRREAPSVEFSGTWPISGSMQNGVCSARKNAVPPSEESEYSSWPTPLSSEGKRGYTTHYTGDPKAGKTLKMEAQIWQTPAVDSFRQRSGDRRDERGLDQQARFWRTPDAPGTTGGPRNRQGSIGHGHQVTIAEQAEHWPTPAPCDQVICAVLPLGRKHMDQLPNYVAHLFGRPDPATPKDGDTSSNDGPTLPLLWPTPRSAENGNDSGSRQRREQGPNPGLKDLAKNWPSPSASMMTPEDQAQAMYAGNDPRRPKYKDANWPTPRSEDSEQTGAHRGVADTLNSATKNWQTPRSHEVVEWNQQKTGEKTLSLTGQAAKTAGKKKLNPAFVEWLMGIQTGWTSLAPIGCALWEIRFRQLLGQLVSARLR